MNKREQKRENKKINEFVRQNYNINKKVKVNDDWYPTYPKHQVNVHLGIFWDNESKEMGNICFVVSGMDDMSVEKRFSSTNLDELIKKWNEWKVFYDSIPQTTNKRWYLERGFIYG